MDAFGDAPAALPASAGCAAISAGQNYHCGELLLPASQLYGGVADLDDVFLRASFLLQGGGGAADEVCPVSSSSFDSLDAPSPPPHLSLLQCHGAAPLPAIAGGEHDGLLLDVFGFSGEAAQAAALGGIGGDISNVIFSSYSSTGGGNISSGESDGHRPRSHDAEVASPTCTLSPLPPTPSSRPSAKRKPDEHPTSGGFHIDSGTAAPPRPCQKRKSSTATTSSCSISFGPELGRGAGYAPDREAIAQVKEMVYRTAAMRPVSLGPEPPAAAAARPLRRNVRISSEPQTVAARLRRERVSERLRALQRLVPGGSKMDTASMLDEAASYLRFLKSQVMALETIGPSSSSLQHYYSGSYGHSHSHNPSGALLAFARGTEHVNPNT